MGAEKCAAVFIFAAPVNVGIAGDLRIVLAVLDSVFCGVADYFGELVAGTLDRAQAEFEMDQCGIFPAECAGEHHVYGGGGGVGGVSVVSRAGGVEGAVLDVRGKDSPQRHGGHRGKEEEIRIKSKIKIRIKRE